MCFRINSKYANTIICKMHKRECEFRATSTPDPWGGQVADVYTFGTSCPPPLLHVRSVRLDAVGCPLFRATFPVCDVPGRSHSACSIPRMRCSGLYARLPFFGATPHPEPRMPWHVPEGTSSGLTGWPAGRTG